VLRQRAAPRGMPKRPQAGSAAAGSDADAKKAKPHVHVSSHKIMIPPNTEPESRKLDAQHESKRAVRTAAANATKTERYREGDYDKFAGPFEAAVASAYAEWRRPLTVTEVITAMTDATDSKVKINKQLKERFAWRGLRDGKWQIARVSGSGLLPFTKESKRTSAPDLSKWRFTPSPAARRPLAELGKLSK